MRAADRNRIDRLPTRAERWIGIFFSALLAIVFLPASIAVSVKVFNSPGGGIAGGVFAAVLALIGVLGVVLLYRFGFTKPRAASSRAQHIYAWVVVVVSVLLLLAAILRLTPSSGVVAPSNNSLERTREK